MGITINTFTPNTQIVSSDVNTNFSNLKSAIQDTSYRAFGWAILGTLLVADNQGMQYVVPANVTAVTLLARTTSGTATIRIQKDTTDVITSYAVTSTVTTTSTFNAAVLTPGQVLSLDITAAAGTDVFVTLETQTTSIV